MVVEITKPKILKLVHEPLEPLLFGFMESIGNALLDVRYKTYSLSTTVDVGFSQLESRIPDVVQEFDPEFFLYVTSADTHHSLSRKGVYEVLTKHGRVLVVDFVRPPGQTKIQVRAPDLYLDLYPSTVKQQGASSVLLGQFLERLRG